MSEYVPYFQRNMCRCGSCERVLVLCCDLRTFRPEQSGGQSLILGRAPPLERHDKGIWTGFCLSTSAISALDAKNCSFASLSYSSIQFQLPMTVVFLSLTLLLWHRTKENKNTATIYEILLTTQAWSSLASCPSLCLGLFI